MNSTCTVGTGKKGKPPVMSIAESQFRFICRAWWAERKQTGRIPKRSIVDIGRIEFGMSETQVYKIRNNEEAAVYLGLSSDLLVARVKAKWAREAKLAA